MQMDLFIKNDFSCRIGLDRYNFLNNQKIHIDSTVDIVEFKINGRY